MKRSEINPMPEYFDRYINKCDDVDLLEDIQISIDEVDSFPLEKWKALGDRVYAPGKWTVKDMLQHLIDTERMFAYRAMAFARKEKQAMLSFSEDDYALHADANRRSIESLVAELRILHQSVKMMFESFNEEML